MNELFQKYKTVLIGIAIGIFLGFTQAGGVVPGITYSAVNSDSLAMFLGIGVALGFFVGLANLSKANPNPHKAAAFSCFLTIGIVALLINLHRGFVSSNIGFNLIALICLAYIPSMVVGGYASKLFSKSA